MADEKGTARGPEIAGRLDMRPPRRFVGGRTTMSKVLTCTAPMSTIGKAATADFMQLFMDICPCDDVFVIVKLDGESRYHERKNSFG